VSGGSIGVWRGPIGAPGAAASSAPAQSGPVRAATHRSTELPRPPHPGRYQLARRCPVPRSARGWPRRPHASARPDPSLPGKTLPPAARRGTSGTAPTQPSAPTPRRSSGTAAARPTAAPPNDPEPLVPAGLTPRRPPGRVAWVEERRHRLMEVPERLLLHRLRASGQPRICGARGGKLPALLQVARRTIASRVPVLVLLDGQVPHVPGVAAVVSHHCFLSESGEQPVSGHTNILANATDISWEVKRRFLPGLEAGDAAPRS
jgi:hypothetical protein